MINTILTGIIQGLFQLVLNIFDLITAPLFNFIFSIFPDLATYFSYILQYISLGLTYVSTVSSLLLITKPMFVALFDYFIIKYTIFLLLLGYKLFINIYNKYKV